MEVAATRCTRCTGGALQEINDYCLCDTLDTYFVFLRTQGADRRLSPDQEQELVKKGREFWRRRSGKWPALRATGRLHENVLAAASSESV